MQTLELTEISFYFIAITLIILVILNKTKKLLLRLTIITTLLLSLILFLISYENTEDIKKNFYAGQIAYNQQDYALAKSLFSEILENRSFYWNKNEYLGDINRKLGMITLDNDNLDENSLILAQEYFEMSIKHAPTSKDYANLGNIFLELEETNEAKKNYSIAIETFNPLESSYEDFAHWHVFLGILQSSSPEEAEKSLLNFQKALSLYADPTYLEYYNDQLITVAELVMDGSIKSSEMLDQIFSEEVEIHFNKAKVYVSEEKYDEVLIEIDSSLKYEQLIQDEDRSSKVLIDSFLTDLAIQLDAKVNEFFSTKKYDNGLTYANLAIQFSERSEMIPSSTLASYYNNRGAIRSYMAPSQEDYERIISDYRKAIELINDSEIYSKRQYYSNLAVAYTQMGNKKAALESTQNYSDLLDKMIEEELLTNDQIDEYKKDIQALNDRNTTST